MSAIRIVLIVALCLYIAFMIYLTSEKVIPISTMAGLVGTAIVFIILNIFEMRKLMLATKREYEAMNNEYDAKVDQAASRILKNMDTSPMEISVHILALNAELDELKSYLRKHADMIESKDGQGRTPLHCAAISGDYETVRYLLTLNNAVEVKDSTDRTPLHYAAQNGTKEMMELLMTNGAKINARDCEGLTPLNFAMKAGKKDIESVLMKKGAFVRPTG